MSSNQEIHYTAYLRGVLKLTRYGEWMHNGTPFEHQRLIALFHRSIVWDGAAQCFYVQIGEGRAEFDCEDTAYFVRHVNESTDPWILTLADETEEPIAADTLEVGSENQVYCTLKNGHRARFMRNAHQGLLQHAVSDQELRLGSKIVKLKRV